MFHWTSTVIRCLRREMGMGMGRLMVEIGMVKNGVDIINIIFCD